MKRFTCLSVFVVLVFLFTGCRASIVQQEELPSERNVTESQYVEERPQGDTTEGSPSGEDVSFVYNSAESIYVPFEKLLKNTTDVVEGVFRDVSVVNGMYYYEFSVTRSLRGKEIGSTVCVQSLPADEIILNTDITYSTYHIGYEKGHSYLLLLQRYSSVYTEEDRFSFVQDSLIIPLDTLQGTSGSMQNMSLYGSKLTDHMTSQEARHSLENGTFKAFILSSVEGNPFDCGREYIHSTDLGSIMEGSQYVIKVRINGIAMESLTGDRITYRCSVENVYKGDLDKQTIEVTFPIDAAEVNDVCIVAVNELEGTAQKNFVMSSKNSVYDVSDEGAIIGILEGN